MLKAVKRLQLGGLLTVSLRTFRIFTQMYKHMPPPPFPPPPHPLPPPPQKVGGGASPSLPFGGKGGDWGGGGVGSGVGGVCLYVCVMLRNINRETVE